MKFKKLSKIVALSLAVLVACFATSPTQANQTFTASEKAWLGATLGVYSLVALSATVISCISVATLCDIRKAKVSAEENEENSEEKNEQAVWTIVSGTGIVCGCFCAYGIIKGILQTKSNLSVTNARVSQDALGALGAIQATLKKSN